MMKTDTSEKVTQTFNGLTEWGIAGSYFKLMATQNAVDVRLFLNGRQVHKALAVSAGHYQRIEYDRVQITTGALESVSWLYAPQEGGSDAVTGDMNVTDRAARLLGIMYGNLGQIAQQLLGGVNVQPITERGFTYGAAFASTTVLAGATNETVLAPGSNTNGVIVWEAGISSQVQAGAGQAALIAKSSAPASGIDGDVLLSVASNLLTAVGITQFSHRRDRPVLVAAGKGLYFRNVAANAEVVAYRSVLYTVL